MKIRGLQQQLAANSYLLPSQRELLTRLLFQLAFNDFSRLAIVGSTGSGKSTLAIVLAELFSNCQEMAVNVALVNLPLASTALRQTIAQQWFAEPDLSLQALQQRIAVADVAEFILLLDNADTLAANDWDWLQSLDVRILSFRQQPDNRMQLNLSLPAVTLDDCQQLLQSEQLDALALAERFARAEGNLHHMLHANAKKIATVAAKANPEVTFPWPLALLTVMLSLLVIMLWLTPATTEQPLQLNQDTVPALIPVAMPEQITANAEDNTLDRIEESTAERTAVSETQEIADVTLAPMTEPELSSDREPAVSATQNLAEGRDLASTLSAKSLPAVSIDSRAKAVVAEQKTVNMTEPGTTVSLTTSAVSATDTSAGIAVNKAEQPILNWDPAQRLVQLAVLSESAAVQRFQADFPKVDHQVYQRRWQGKEQWVVIAGPFSSNSQALQFVGSLPEKLKRSGPFPKTVRAVQQEILAWQRTNPETDEQEN